ncbi:hypothetical protein BJF93_13420 [Xaviernesmea oryzae]|uniref:Pyruvate dehydrogenase complex repressor n=1 Tax=Xaviernesmea oryzae TaxID=464029 RepID=A0A1Q9AR03_9HYPH|nr:FCD domain-containing protein [Xaviernesmea oryzae]OLP57844.1 hypothetical protein BJF93_13420 [Xaviernesmea oryzae]SEL34398.1 GntR family transcriptional regulator, L-lactate dehydrogenase operon regulator [Xaviernesmea oryzae]
MGPLANQIETMLREQALAPGVRLPGERQLAADLGVSRSSLREALRELISHGRLTSRQGGGTFVAAEKFPEPTIVTPASASPISAALAPLSSLAEGEPGYWLDVMELRRSLEGDAAALAAERATPGDHARLKAALAHVMAPRPEAPHAQAEADAAFHMTVAEASHNIVLRQVMAGLFDLLRASISESLQALYRAPASAEPLARQHHAIVKAILAGDGPCARAAALDHLDHVATQLRPLAEAAARHRRAAMALTDHRLRAHAAPDGAASSSTPLQDPLIP